MTRFLLLALIAGLLLPTPSQSDTNHFGAGDVFELDLGDSEIPLTPKQERKQKLLKEKLKMKTNEREKETTTYYLKEIKSQHS